MVIPLEADLAIAEVPVSGGDPVGVKVGLRHILLALVRKPDYLNVSRNCARHRERQPDVFDCPAAVEHPIETSDHHDFL